MRLGGRAVVAVAMMVGFYVFALAIVAALVIVGALVIVAAHAGWGAMYGVMLLVVAGMIVWSVAPRFDRFEPPGPEITGVEHPELFAEIRRVCKETGQRVPHHVYLVSDVNAGVTQRGGVMGFGGVRVMVIGLALLRCVRVDELRAVLAHEMGHFDGGDTRLGPWIYKTRGALIRTIFNFQRAGHSYPELGRLLGLIQAPFKWFLRGFLRVSQSIARAQELGADVIAVRTAGRRAFVGSLEKTHGASLAYSIYLHEYVGPLVDRGVLPPVGEGFSRLLASQKLNELLDNLVDHERTKGRTDPYDSHPALRDRIAAAEALDGIEEPDEDDRDARPAIELVRGAGKLEDDSLASCVESKLDRIAWDDAAAVWSAMWRERIAGLADFRLGKIALDAFATSPQEIRVVAREGMDARIHARASDDDLRRWWGSLVGTGFAVTLLNEGFAASTLPGEPVRMTRGDVTVHPFREVAARLRGGTSAEDWSARVAALGLAGRTFG